MNKELYENNKKILAYRSSMPLADKIEHTAYVKRFYWR